MRDTFLLIRVITDFEKIYTFDMMLEDKESEYRANKIFLLKDEGYLVPEIRKITNHNMITT